MEHKHLPVIDDPHDNMPKKRGWIPGRVWIWTRRLTQTIAWMAVLVAPLLGGWQRLDRRELANWANSGWDVPTAIRQHLPLGDAPAKVYRVNKLLGGGAASDFLTVPALDPLAGAVALIAAPDNWPTWLALAFTVLVAALAGRAFCGWLCPFGSLARSLEFFRSLLPFSKQLALPKRRWLRWFILLSALGLSVLGFHVFLYLTLPHWLLQQSIYSAWLLGGGGAIGGLLLGVLAIGFIVGPTHYCASLCPTGAALSLLGRKKVIHVLIDDRDACGSKCGLCNRACWLQLEPDQGDPGPDCDSCTRCFTSCPRANLRVSWKKPALAATLITLSFGASYSSPAYAQTQDASKPRLLLSGERVIDGVTVALSVVDFSKVRLDADDPEQMQQMEVSFFMARGDRKPADKRGVLPPREVYDGPLTIRVLASDNTTKQTLHFSAPNSPKSTPNRSIFRRRIPAILEPGDQIQVKGVKAWLPEPTSWVIPFSGNSRPWFLWFGWFVAGALLCGGALWLALSIGKKDRMQAILET